MNFPRQKDGTFLYCFQLQREGEWQTISMNNYFVEGISFDLAPSRIHQEQRVERLWGEGSGCDTEGKSLNYAFEGIVEPFATSWLRFGLTVHLEKELQLSYQPMVEPQLIVWLGELHGFNDRQYLEWHHLQIANPTPSIQGVRGNDLPALYYYDPFHNVQWCLYFDMEQMAWFTRRNAARFLTYQCSARTLYAQQNKYGIGLWADDFLGYTFPQGNQHFEWYVTAAPCEKTPSPAQALEWMMEQLTDLVPADPPGPPNINGENVSWASFAQGAKRELVDEDLSFAVVDEVPGYLAYIPESSAWFNDRLHLELVTQTDLLWPWLIWNHDFPDEKLEKRIAALLAHLNTYFRPEARFISNDFPHPNGEEIVDSWYFFENGLVKWGWIALLSGNHELTNDFLLAFSDVILLARRVGYLFPMFYEATQREPLYSANYANAGLYAYAAVLAETVTGEALYLGEAQRALAALVNLPLDTIYHQPQELAFGAAAAAYYGRRSGDPLAFQWARHLFHAELRMAYWYDDPARVAQAYHVRGMFQACASVLYPALKESVEAILPWLHLIDAGWASALMLRMIDLQRRNDFYFFDDCLPAGRRKGAVPPHSAGNGRFIPYENLALLEFEGQTGEIGKEVYGTGELFWLALLFEQYAQSDDPQVMVLCTDLLDAHHVVKYGAGWRFVLFNPTKKQRCVLFRPMRAKKASACCEINSYGQLIPEKGDALLERLQRRGSICVQLAPGEWRYVHLMPTEAT